MVLPAGRLTGYRRPLPSTPQTLAEVVAAPPAAAISDAIARMRAIDAALPMADGLAWFTMLYLQVTEAIHASAGRPMFRDARYLDTLDGVVGFAGRGLPPPLA